MAAYPEDRALLMIGESFHTADMYYVTGFLVGDPVIYLDKGDGQSLLVVGDFEREGAAAHSKAARVKGFQDLGSSELPTDLRPHERLARVALRALQEEGVTRAITTDTFPLSTADYLRANGIDLACRPDLLQEPREVKQPAELAAIESAQHATERAMDTAIRLIAEATVGEDGILYDGDLPVTSERLRAVIEASLMEDNCTGEGTIAASGPDTAQPHNRGHGPIYAGQPVVLDIFPRHKEHRYFADMTRTVSKGQPDGEIVRMYDLTNQALDLALDMIRPGANGREIFEAVCRFYEEHGYPTYLREKRMPDTGFVHSLGHGVGLDIHEGPHLSRRDETLREGQVITVEPGLYTPGLGGVRIEDMVVVTADGYRNLTDYPKTLVV